VISDDSTDHTPDIAREEGAVVVKPDEAGYGYAYRYAFERCRGEYIIIGDADTTYDFEQFLSCWSKLWRATPIWSWEVDSKEKSKTARCRRSTNTSVIRC